MSFLRIFVRQFAHPAGFWGRVVAFRLDISNCQANEWTVSLLDLRPTDRVLEVGYGTGLTLQITARRVPQGFVAGVDSSQTMVEIARKQGTCRAYDPAEVVAALKQAGFARTWLEKKEFVARKVHYTGLVALGEKE